MALKYQALNGMVISKTTTIEGTNLEKAGTPVFLRGIKTDEGYVLPFMGFQGSDTPTSASRTDLTLSSNTISLSSSILAPITIDGVNYTGSTSSNLVFSNYISITGYVAKTYTINGYFTIVKASSSGGISTMIYEVNNFQRDTRNSSTTWIILTIEKTASEVILSVTFTPTT